MAPPIYKKGFLINFIVNASSSLQPDTGVCQLIEQVGHKVDGNDPGGQNNHDGLNHGEITAGNAGQQQSAYTGDVEDLFDDDAARHDLGSRNCQKSDDGDKSVFQNVSDQDRSTVVAAASGSADIVVLLFLLNGATEHFDGHSDAGNGNGEGSKKQVL